MSADVDDILGEEGEGEGVSLDGDLEDMLTGSEGEADADAGSEGEGVSLDGDLEDMLAGSEGETDADAGSEDEGVSLDGDLEDMLAGSDGETDDDAGGEDEGVSLDSDLEDMLAGGGEDEDAESGGEVKAPPGSAPPPAVNAGLEASRASLSATEAVNLDFLLDIQLHTTFEVGRSQMVVSDLLTLGQGSVVELHRLVGEELDLFVNGKLIAKGEVVVVNEKFGCRISEIISPQDRVKHLATF